MTVGKGDDVVLHISVVGIQSRITVRIGYSSLLIVAIIGGYDRFAVSIGHFEKIAALVVLVLGDLVIRIRLGNDLTDRIVCIACCMVQ
ncbi:unknown [Clostridium sp. CAG:448]|nr:unknown [Clostridium sp. CAG:448]